MVGADEYLAQILRSRSLDHSMTTIGQTVREEMLPILRSWAPDCLRQVSLSGSYAKGTAIRGGSDVDLFVSLDCNTSMTLEQIYESLCKKLNSSGYEIRKQNVSVRIVHRGHSVDLVPGLRSNSFSEDHRIYVRRLSSWQKTNVLQQINHVLSSQQQNEIRLMKCWRDFHKIDVPSFVIELATIEALRRISGTSLSQRILRVLEYFSSRGLQMTLLDPGCPSRNVYDELTSTEKKLIQSKSTISLQAHNWGEIIQ